MNIADFLIKKLVDYHVKDVFGIPGGVILDLIYAIEKNDKISSHLCYHEQGAAFAAEGYAQVNGTLGAVYATRGPGFTNLLTSMADAYQESIPVLFITAHNKNNYMSKMRMENDQELDSIAISKKITKYSVRIDNIEDAANEIQNACMIALDGRKGPVLIDIAASLWCEEAVINSCNHFDNIKSDSQNNTLEKNLCSLINDSKRPIILAGSGVQLSGTSSEIRTFSEDHRIPILSSRCSQDIFAGSNMYFGYIGSHGIRYSNFILSKTDFIISLGNRLSFPIDSKSFRTVFEHSKTLRIDIDLNELERKIPNSLNYHMDLRDFANRISNISAKVSDEKWISVCNTLKNTLRNNDSDYPIDQISEIMNSASENTVFVSDVGNNEFWVSRAYELSKASNRILYSRAFGALGNALAKAIGVYYKTRHPVICFIGDQGLQINIQELQTISDNYLPILIVLLNNHSSGMIRSRQVKKYHSQFIHTTSTSGYGTPDFKVVCSAYGIDHVCRYAGEKIDKPQMVEIDISDKIDLQPSLPNGSACQNMTPPIDGTMYNYLNNL